jgi:hypothetical protein
LISTKIVGRSAGELRDAHFRLAKQAALLLAAQRGIAVLRRKEGGGALALLFRPQFSFRCGSAGTA